MMRIYAIIMTFLVGVMVPIVGLVLIFMSISEGVFSGFVFGVIFIGLSFLVWYPYIQEKNNRKSGKSNFGLPTRSEGQERERAKAEKYGFLTYSYGHKIYHTKTNYPCESEPAFRRLQNVPHDGREHWEHINTPYLIVVDHSNPEYRSVLLTTTLAELRGEANRERAIKENVPYYRRAINYKSQNVRDYAFELTYEVETNKPYTVEQALVAELYEYDIEVGRESHQNSYYNCFKYDIAYNSNNDIEPRRINKRAISLEECKRLYDPLSMHVEGIYCYRMEGKRYQRTDADPCNSFNVYRNCLPYKSALDKIIEFRKDPYTYTSFSVSNKYKHETLKIKYMTAKFDDDEALKKLKKFLGSGTFICDSTNRVFYKIDKTAKNEILEELNEKYPTGIDTPYGIDSKCLIIGLTSNVSHAEEIAKVYKKYNEITG